MRERPFAAVVHAGPPPSLTMVGAVDWHALGAFREAVHKHVASVAEPLVDLSAVDHLSAAAVGVLAFASTRARVSGSVLTVVASRGSVADHVLHLMAQPHEHLAPRHRS